MAAIDITLMFGSDSGIVSALGLSSVSEITTVKAVKAFERLFPQSYYAYDAGSLLSFNPTDIETVGFNQYDNSKQTENVHVLADHKYRIKGTYSGLTYSDGTNVTVTDGYFTPDRVDYLTLSGGNDVDTCVHLSWSGWRDPAEDYEAYWKQDTDLSWIRQIQYQGAPLFPNGLCKAGDAYDEISDGKAIKRVGSVDLGTLNWNTSWWGSAGMLYVELIGKTKGGTNIIYPLGPTVPNDNTLSNKIGICGNRSNSYIYVGDAKTHSSASEFVSSLNGVIAYYELATPIVVDLPDGINLNYRMDDFGTEELINLDAAANTPGLCKPTLVDIGYQTNLRDKIRRLDDNYVSFTTDQTETASAEEKAQARRNIDTVDKDGVYPQMHVGLADNLVSPDGNVDTDNFIFRTTAGSEDVSSGYATLQKLEGSTVVWNQNLSGCSNAGGLTITQLDNGVININGTTNATYFNPFITKWGSTSLALTNCPIGKYVMYVNVINNPDNINLQISALNDRIHFTYNTSDFTKSYSVIGSCTNTSLGGGFGMSAYGGSGIEFNNVKIQVSLFNITQMFGSGNEPSTVEEFEAWLAKNVGYKEYYPYDAGSLLSVDVSGLKTVGFNLYNNTTGTAKLPGSTGTVDLAEGKYCYQITGSYSTVLGGDGTPILPNANGYFNVETPQEITVTGGDDTTCVHLCWSGYRNGDFEQYWNETLDLSFISNLKYTPEGGEEKQLFPNGLCSAGDVRDEITATKAIKRVGSVDLGTLDWTYYSNRLLMTTYNVKMKSSTHNLVSAKYEYVFELNSSTKGGMNAELYTTKNLNVQDLNYTDAATFKAAMSGVMLYYELATPIEVAITPEQNLNYRMDDFGTEEFVSSSESIPQTTSPYSVIKYMDNLRDKLRNIDKNFVGYDEQIVSEEKKSIARGNIGAAATSGSYPELLAGNLVGQTVDRDTYLIRPTGNGGEDVASGTARVISMEGNSCVWNQLVQNGNFSDGTTGWSGTSGATVSDGKITIPNGQTIFQTSKSLLNHKVFVKLTARYVEATGNPRFKLRKYDNGAINDFAAVVTEEFTTFSNIITIIGGSGTNNNLYLIIENCTAEITNVQLIDLTLLGIDNLTTVAEVEAWLAQHVGTKPYYAYNAGTILSAQTLGIKTYGQNLLNPETKKATLIPYSWEVNSNIYTIKNLPSGATATYTPDKTSVAETVDVSSGSLDITSYGSGVLELSDATANTYVCMKWDGTKDNDIVPYEDHTYNFDVRKVYGKANGEGSYVQCFPQGMRSAGSVHSTLTASEAVDRIGSVNLGSLTWDYRTYGGHLYFIASSMPSEEPYINPNGVNFVYNLICTKYSSDTWGHIYNNINDKSIGIYHNEYAFVVYDSAYTDATTFRTAMSGVLLYYELATPITYTNLIYSEDEGTTGTPLADVLINIDVNNWSMEEQLLPAYADGNPTSISATISTIYGLNAVEAIAKLQKTTYTESEVHSNLASLLSCINTNCSTVLGGTFSISDTATEKVFSFTFTPNE